MTKSFKELYMENSKHSNYQTLPTNFKGLLDDKELNIQSRYEKERLQYILKNVDVVDKTVLDIGGNIGYFSFETSNRGSSRVDYYEGNPTHAEFVQRAVEELDLDEKIKVFRKYYGFEQEGGTYDIAYLLNVVHHLGDDFGESSSVDSAKMQMLDCVNHMARIAKVLVFQMGFNWCGDRNKCLFEHGTKSEMETFIQQGTEHCWEVIRIGVAVKKDDRIEYEDMNAENNQRDDGLGEFLNRPIFILKSKVI